MLNINRIIFNTQVEGPGLRVCIWFQGCSRHCKGCFATDTWSFEERQMLLVEDIIDKIRKEPNIDGVTILGGEPLDQIDDLILLVKAIKSLELTVILFTGYYYSEICNNDKFLELKEYIDVLIDGPYDEQQRDFSVPMIGSKNQSFYFFTDKYSIRDFPKNKIEVRITPEGQIKINGQGPMFCDRRIKKYEYIQ